MTYAFNCRTREPRFLYSGLHEFAASVAKYLLGDLRGVTRGKRQVKSILIGHHPGEVHQVVKERLAQQIETRDDLSLLEASKSLVNVVRTIGNHSHRDRVQNHASRL